MVLNILSATEYYSQVWEENLDLISIKYISRMLLHFADDFNTNSFLIVIGSMNTICVLGK